MEFIHHIQIQSNSQFQAVLISTTLFHVLSIAFNTHEVKNKIFVGFALHHSAQIIVLHVAQFAPKVIRLLKSCTGNVTKLHIKTLWDVTKCLFVATLYKT